VDPGAGRLSRRLWLAAGALALVGLAALLLSSGAAQAANDPPPSGGPVIGDWTVTDARSYAGCTIGLSGNLTVSGSGNLTLDAVRLVMGSLFQGQYGIEVLSGGELLLKDGTVVTAASGYEYRFVVRPGGNLTVSGSELRGCGYAWGTSGETAGVCLLSDGCRFDQSLVSSSDFGVVVNGASPTFTDCSFSGNSQGCVVINSSATFSGCTFEYNGNGANFENWSGSLSNCTLAFNTGFGLLAYGSGGNVSRCKFQGNTAGNCVLIGSDAGVSDCTLRDSLYGIYIDGGRPRVTNCSLTGNRYGAYLYKSASSFDGCTISQSSRFGLSCSFGAPSLSNCSIFDTGYSPQNGFYWGRGIEAFATDLSFSGGQLYHNYFGIEARYSALSVSEVQFQANAVGIWALESRADITDCDFSKNLQIGAHLKEYCTGSFERCTFTCMTQGAAFDLHTSTRMGNSSFSNCREGLRLYDCDPDAAVTGCTFENNSIGASLMGSAGRVLSCSFASNANYSLSCSGGSAEIRNCSFRDCPTNALTLDGCGGVIDGNRFDKVESAGIFGRNATSEISNNTFSSGRGTAIHSVGTGGAPDIHDNLFFKNGLGVALSDGSSGRVHHNDFDRNEQAGLSLRSARGEIFCNTVNGSIHGISCILLSEASIHDNEVFDNEVGIICEDSSNATVTGNYVHDNSQAGILARMSYPALSKNSVWGNLDGVVVAACPGPAAVTLFGDSLFNNTNGFSGLDSMVALEGCNFTDNSLAGARLVNCISSVRHGSFSRNRDGLRPEGGTLRVEQCDFFQNNDTGIITDAADAVIEGCYFSQNTDGALDLGNSTLRFIDGVFESNRVTGFFCQGSTQASWTVGRAARAANDWLALRGNLTVLPGGSLRLANTTLHLMLSSPGDGGIEVRGGGRLEMVLGSKVEAAEPANKYSFRLLPGGNLTIEEGILQDCGGAWGPAGERPGLVLQSSDCALREVWFQNCSFGLVAYGITGDFEYLTFAGCDYAVVAISSRLRLDNSSIYLSISDDVQLQRGSVVKLVNTTFDRGRVSLLDHDCLLEVYWYLGINVAWQNRALVEGANLTLEDAAGTRQAGGLTDEHGWLLWVPVLEYRQTSLSTDARNPYAITVDKANVTFQQTITFQKSQVLNITLYDLAPPVIRAEFPVQGAILNLSPVEARGVASDNETGLDRVDWSSDGRNWQPANGTDRWSFLAPLADGTHNLSVRATDAAGNRAVLGIDITVKTRISVLELASPAEGLLTRDPVLIVKGITESGADIQINGLAVPVLSGNFSATVTLSEGNNTLMVTASDAAGNTIFLTRTVVLDTTPPFIELGSPRDGSYTNIRETTVSGRTEPGAKVMVNGQVLINTGGRFSLVVDLPSDSNRINVTAVDPAGNANSTEVTVLVDLEPPVLDIISPVSGRHTAARSVTITGTTEPFSTVTAWDRSVTAGADGRFSMNLSILYGNNTLTLRSEDRAGNVNTVNWYVVRDRPSAEPGPPWMTALAGVAILFTAENAAIYVYRRRRDVPAPAIAASSLPTQTRPEPEVPTAEAEAAVPEAVAEPVPPEALPVGDDEEIEMVDMR